MLGLPAMDAAQALADLTEISSQIDAAVLAATTEQCSRSTLADAAGQRSPRPARELLQAAEDAERPRRVADLVVRVARRIRLRRPARRADDRRG